MDQVVDGNSYRSAVPSGPAIDENPDRTEHPTAAVPDLARTAQQCELVEVVVQHSPAVFEGPAAVDAGELLSQVVGHGVWMAETLALQQREALRRLHTKFDGQRCVSRFVVHRGLDCPCHGCSPLATVSGSEVTG